MDGRNPAKFQLPNWLAGFLPSTVAAPIKRGASKLAKTNERNQTIRLLVLGVNLLQSGHFFVNRCAFNRCIAKHLGRLFLIAWTLI